MKTNKILIIILLLVVNNNIFSQNNSTATIEVSTEIGGQLSYKNVDDRNYQNVATLWDNDSHSIQINKPGNYNIKMVYGDGREEVKDLTITSRGTIKINFLRYSIGSYGPAGGRIFYDKGNNDGGWRYLEAAPSNIILWREDNRSSDGFRYYNVQRNWNDGTPSWGGYNRVIGTSSAIGTGKENTIIISNVLSSMGVTNSAAQYCLALNYNGFKDWYLPSKEELEIMAKNLINRNVGFERNKIYISSSEISNYSAWYLCINNEGNNYFFNGYSKNSSARLWAIRSF